MKRTVARTLIQAVAIIVVGGLGATIHAALHAPVIIHGAASPAPKSGTAAPGDEGKSASKIGTVTLKEAYALFKENKAVFIDARGRDEYEAGHVPGAFWLPFSEFFSGQPPPVTQDMPQDMPIVVYCEGGDCHASRQVAEMLLDYGFEDVRVLEIGWPGWDKAKYPQETGKPLYGS